MATSVKFNFGLIVGTVTLEELSFFIPTMYFMAVHHRIFKETLWELNHSFDERSGTSEGIRSEYELFLTLCDVERDDG